MTMKKANKKSFWIFLLLVLVIIALPFAIATFVYFYRNQAHVDTETKHICGEYQKCNRSTNEDKRKLQIYREWILPDV